ncbi:hypothetical protein HJFPF1_04386 [Paramyrothecium foliicola]|nr:hypothetical protein HJFPF1_04386 [Paramyrothecium foliicola]
MAQPWARDLEFGTRGEHWSNPEVDLDTEKGHEAIERTDAAIHAIVGRGARRRQGEVKSTIEPAYTHYDIPKALYQKAQDHQDQLSHDERQLLLNRGDVIGKALAQPDALTEDETYQVLLWPAPGVVHANIQAARGGTPGSPFELHARGKAALTRAQPLLGSLGNEEILLLARYFYTEATHDFGALLHTLSLPGAKEAQELLHDRLGLDHAVAQAAMNHHVTQISQSLTPMPRGYAPPRSSLGLSTRPEPQKVLHAILTLHEQRQNGSITAEEADSHSKECLEALRIISFTRHTPETWKNNWPQLPVIETNEDRQGAGSWPRGTERSPLDLFKNEKGLSDLWISTGWFVLSEEQRQTYRDWCEALRREAWTLQQPYSPPQDPMSPLIEQEPQDVAYAIALLNEQRRLGTITAEADDYRQRECMAVLRAFSDARRHPKPGPWPEMAPVSDADLDGAGPWPIMATQKSPVWLFAADEQIWGWYEKMAWRTIDEERRQIYRDLSERVRLEAWDEYNRTRAARNYSTDAFPSAS